VTVDGRLALNELMSCEFFLDTLDQCYSIAIRARRAYELLNEGFVPRTCATDRLLTASSA
jgi:hypothetical protein